MPGRGRKKKSRARKGTGTIWEYRPGKFRGLIELGVDADGKRIRKSATGKSEKEVQDKLDAFKNDARNGIIPNEKITVAQHFEDWLRSKKPPATASATHSKYSRLFKNHISPALGHVRLAKLDYRQINLLYEQLDEQGKKRSTVASIASVLKMGLEDAVRKRLIHENPAKLAAKRTPGKQEARCMSQDEMRAFLRAVQGDRLQYFFILLLHTGFRPGEALGLSWDAVNLEDRTLKVQQALHEEDGKLFLGDLKSKAAYRSVNLSTDAVRAIELQHDLQLNTMIDAADKWQNKDNLVFTDRYGGYLRRTNIIRRDLKRVKERVAEATEKRITLDGVTLHTFRHTHASTLIFQGVDIKVVSAVLGHESVSFTYDVYGHLLPGSTERAAQAMDAFMNAL